MNYGGRQWIFAHNGGHSKILILTFTDVLPQWVIPTVSVHFAIYWINWWTQFGYDEPKSRSDFWFARWWFLQALQNMAPLIFVYRMDRRYLVMHITKLHWLVREYPFKPAQLIDIDVEVDFSQVTTPEDGCALSITTEPLTRNWSMDSICSRVKWFDFKMVNQFVLQMTHVDTFRNESTWILSLKRVTTSRSILILDQRYLKYKMHVVNNINFI